MISITIAGISYAGWLSVSVRRSLDSLAHSFEFRATDRWTEADSPRPIQLGDYCIVDSDGTDLTQGYVSNVLYEVTSESVTIRVAGRSKTADLVDCAAIHQTGQWRDARPTDILADICQPFDILVTYSGHLPGSTDRIARYELVQGESAYDAIDRVCRAMSWLPITSSDGNLRVIQVDPSSRAKYLDVPSAIRRTLESDEQGRYSEYRAITQRDAKAVGSLRSVTGSVSVTDPSVARYRPTIVHSDRASSDAELLSYVTWTRNTREAATQRVTYELPDVTDVWEPGDIVAVRDTVLGIDEPMVLVSTSANVSAESCTTELQLARAYAYTSEPIPDHSLIRKRPKKGIDTSWTS